MIIEINNAQFIYILVALSENLGICNIMQTSTLADKRFMHYRSLQNIGIPIQVDKYKIMLISKPWFRLKGSYRYIKLNNTE